MNARIQILIAAALFSLGGLGIKLCSFGPWQIGGLRCAIAALTVLLILPEARRTWSWKIVLVGIAYAATLILFVWGNKTTTAANTIFIQSSAPLWILLLSPLMLKEPILSRDVLTLIVMGLGLVLFFMAPEKTTMLSPDIARGNWIALASGVCFAIEIIGLRALRDGGDAERAARLVPGARERGGGSAAALVCGNTIAFLVCLPLLITGGSGTPGGFMTGSFRDWAVLVFLGVVQVALAYVFYTRGLRHLPATRASLISLIEPVMNPLWVWLAFRVEKPGPLAVLGGALILSAAAYQSLVRDSNRRG